MGTPLGPKYIPYTYMDPLGYSMLDNRDCGFNSRTGKTCGWLSKLWPLFGYPKY